jgi:hypothetical protein
MNVQFFFTKTGAAPKGGPGFFAAGCRVQGEQALLIAKKTKKASPE